MEVCFLDLKEKEIVNVYDGKKLGRIIDILFDTASGQVKGIVVPGDKKIFRKNEDIFVPLDRLKKIGDDVILVSLQTGMGFSPGMQQSHLPNSNMQNYHNNFSSANSYSNQLAKNEYSSYVRYKPLSNRKYK